MSKFVASVTDVIPGVDILAEDFNAARKQLGGLMPAVEYYVNEALTEHQDHHEIFVVHHNAEVADPIAAVLNAKYEEEVSKMKQHGIEEAETEVNAPKLSYTFQGNETPVAFGNEVVSMESTQEQAIANAVNSMKKPNKTKKEEKGAIEMKNINNLVNKGNNVTEEDALSIAEKFTAANSAKMKDAQAVAKPSNSIKNVVAGNVKGAVSEAKEESKQQSGIPTFGGGMKFESSNNETPNTKEETKGGNNMNSVKDKVKAAAPAPQGGNGLKEYTGPTYSFDGPSSAGEAKAMADAENSRSGGFDETAREEKGFSSNGIPWYLNAELYPEVANVAWYHEHRQDLPKNELGLTRISFLNPQDKKYIPYKNNYTLIVELAWGKGVNARIRLTHFTKEMKAQVEARGYKASNSDWKTGNIQWVTDYKTKQLAPRFAYSVPNDFVIAVKCDGTVNTKEGTKACGRTVNVHAKRAATCDCGKKYNPIELALTKESAQGLEFVEDKYQPQWNKVVLDNSNITVHKEALALALAIAQYDRFLPMHGLVEEEGQEG